MGEKEDQDFQVTVRNGADRVAQYQDLTGAIHQSVLVNKRWASNQEKASHSNNQGNYLFRRVFPDQKRSRTGGLISLLDQSPRSRCYWAQQDHCCVAGQSDLACCKKRTAYCKCVLRAKRVAPSPVNCLMQEWLVLSEDSQVVGYQWSRSYQSLYKFNWENCIWN